MCNYWHYFISKTTIDFAGSFTVSLSFLSLVSLNSFGATTFGWLKSLKSATFLEVKLKKNKLTVKVPAKSIVVMNIK